MTRTTPISKRPAAKKVEADPVLAYAEGVAAGHYRAGPLVRAACARHIVDMREGPSRGLVWDREAAMRAINYFPDVLRLDDGSPFVLQPWQAFIVGSLFGWKNSFGTRRFLTAYIEVGKGNGKSPMAGGIGLYMLASDNEPKAEVYAAATTRDQAKILFQDAVNMVKASPALTRRITTSGIAEVTNLAHMQSGSWFRPISSEGRGLDGKRVHCALIDEVHEHPSPVVVNKMRFGTKGRKQALIVEITNSGVNRNSICFQHHEYSERVVTGQIPDDTWFAYVCGLDQGEDPLNDPSCWIKANPNLGVSIQPAYLEGQVREARGMPANASMVKRLNFCQWVDAANPAIPQELWFACRVDHIDERNLRHLECRGGLDLSGTRDLTALARMYEPDEDGIVYAIVELWTPKDTLEERARRDAVPYDLWVDQRHVHATPGRAVQYAYVAQRMSELQVEVGLNTVAFDPYRIKYLEVDLANINCDIELIPHGQGYRAATESDLWMPRSVELLEALIAQGRLRVLINPAVDYAASSAVHVMSPKGESIYDKSKSTGRIDAMVALAMAAGFFDDEIVTTGRSIYDDWDGESSEPAAEPEAERKEDDDEKPGDEGEEEGDAEGIDWKILDNPSHPRWREMLDRWERSKGMDQDQDE